MTAITLGPLVLAADRFAAGLAAAAFLIAATLLARRVDSRLDAWSGSVLLGGLVAARLGHVVMYWEAFASEPWRIVAIWQGGFSLLAGAAAVLLITAFYTRTLRFGLAAAAALGAAGLVAVVTLALTQATLGQPAPTERIPGLSGGDRAIADFRGQPAVVNLWASWCPPCIREMPLLARTAAERRDVAFVFINQGESAETIERFFKRTGVRLENVLRDASGSVPRYYGTRGLPVTLFLRADGTLSSLHTGEMSPEHLREQIDRLTAVPR